MAENGLLPRWHHRHEPPSEAIPESQKQYNDVATETFGPLEKCEAANDNVPQSVDFTVPPWHERNRDIPHADKRGRYIGLSRGRENHQKFVSAIDSWRATTDRTLAGVSALAELTGYVYLGSPYSKYAAGHDRAALVVGQCAAKLMNKGLVIFSPIAHGHSITICGDLPLDWGFWKRQCDPMIDGAAALVVLMMEGWWDSVGLEYEINRAIERSIPILYIEPAQLEVVEALTGRGEE